MKGAARTLRVRIVVRALALAGCGLAVAAAAGPPRAPGGREIIASIEQGGIPAVGRIGDIRRLDTHGFSARIWVERVLGPHADAYPEGDPLRIAWEELATSRPPRFQEPDRVLVVLERLGSESIWRRRLPDPSVRRQTFGIAAGGDAFLHDPAPGSLDALHHYLAIAPGERSSTAGAGALAALARAAQLPLALSAVRRLQAMPAVGSLLGTAGEAALVEALERDDAEPELSAALLPVLAAVATPSLERQLAQRAGEREPPAPARVFRAWARCRQAGLPEKAQRWLLGRPEADYRLAATESLAADDASTLRSLRAADPEASVRAAALLRLAALLDSEALPDALASLADPAPTVRAAAARTAGALGPPAVAPLQAVVDGTWPDCCADSADAARAAIAGLRLAGAPGRQALVEIAVSHPDPQLRKLAELALGELETDAH